MKISNFVKKRKLLFASIGMFVIISCISVSYASLNTEMMITGQAYIRVDEDIRVTDIKMISTENESYETYGSKYAKDSTNMYITLPNIHSKITYEITIQNKSEHVYIISSMTDQLVNPNITYVVNNYKIGQAIPGKSTTTVNITFQYLGDTLPSDITQIATINYKFERPSAAHLYFDNENVNTTCADVQCALDEIYSRF